MKSKYINFKKNNNFEDKINSFVTAKITDVKDYDLIGEIL